MKKDVQSIFPEIKLYLTRVGVTKIKKAIKVKRPNRTVVLIPEIEVVVDLPESQKGIHMSRSNEVVNECVEETSERPVAGMENLCAIMARKLLKRHEYARRAEVRMVADYAIERVTPVSRILTHEISKLEARAIAIRKNNRTEVRKMIGAEVVGITTCPCAQEMVSSKFNFPENLPVATHNQRTTGKVLIEVPENYDIEADELIEIIESSLSSPTYEILKREDELEIIIKAHKKPMFVEDVVREMAAKVIKSYGNLPDDCFIFVRAESEESIHKHNAFAEKSSTIGKLKKEMES